jgi:hypothetical protein
MAWTCNMHAQYENCLQSFGQKIRNSDHLGDVEVNATMIFS